MSRYKVWYFQDCGYAGMTCGCEISTEDISDAMENFPKYVRDQGYACTAQPTDLEEIEILDTPTIKERFLAIRSRYVGPKIIITKEEAEYGMG